MVLGPGALAEIVPEVEKRVMEKEGAVLIEDQDEQEHSFSMPLSSAR
tara:strand:+ start:702 stop:842 length:141 start_codon:yes stop_codon:yes gene_type:complete